MKIIEITNLQMITKSLRNNDLWSRGYHDQITIIIIQAVVLYVPLVGLDVS
jgi:hypothetical protein